MGELLFWQREKDSTSAAAEARSRGKRATGTFSDAAPVRFPPGLLHKKTRPLGVCFFVERMRGIEPPLSAWEAGVLPMNYIRGWS